MKKIHRPGIWAGKIRIRKYFNVLPHKFAKHFIGSLIISTSAHHLNASKDYRENVQKLRAQYGANYTDERSAEQPPLAAMALDDSLKINESVDPITQAIHKKLIDEKHAAKFNTFLVDFTKQAGAIWKCHEKTKNKILAEYVKQFEAHEIYTNKDKHANVAQEKIDQYYIQEYTKLYHTVYTAHFKTTAPEEVAQALARRTYFDQSNACCVIL